MASDSPAKGRTAPPASADSPEARQPKDESFPLSAYVENPGSHNFPVHVLAGAAVLNGWADGTKLTKDQLREGVEAFLKHTPDREE